MRLLELFGDEIFFSEFEIKNHIYSKDNILLNIVLIKGSIAFQYLLLKNNKNNDLLLISIDVNNKQITPINAVLIENLLAYLKSYLSSSFNDNKIDMEIDEIDQIIDYFTSFKIKKENYYTYKNFTILASNDRRLIECDCTIFNEYVSLVPDEVFLIFTKNGFVYGEILFSLYKLPRDIHLSNDLTITCGIKNDKVFEEVGVIYKTELVNEKHYKFIIGSFIHELTNINISHYISKNLTLESHIYSLINNDVLARENIIFEDREQSYSPYLVLIPIKNLIINNSFGIANVQFYTKDEAIVMFEGFKELHDEDDEKILSEFKTYAKVIVEGSDIQVAYNRGKEIINDVIEILILISKNERIFSIYNSGNIYNEWNRNRFHQNPECSSIYYIENIIGYEQILHDSEYNRNNTDLIIDSSYSDIFKELIWFEEKIFNKLNSINSRVDKQLFNSIKWLNRSWKAKDLEDKVIYTNIAMEFLVDEVKTNPYIPKDVVGKFKKSVKEILKGDEYKEEDKQKLKEKAFSMLSDPPLKVKIQALMKELNIVITDNEFSKLWEVRKYRNDLVHAKEEEVLINKNNIILANVLLGQFIVNRLKLSDGVGE